MIHKLTKIQLARYNNAYRIYTKLKKLFDKGYLIWDDFDDKVQSVEWITNHVNGDQFLIKTQHRGLTRVFYGNPEFDEGLLITKEEFSEMFDGWTYLKPQHIKEFKV